MSPVEKELRRLARCIVSELGLLFLAIAFVTGYGYVVLLFVNLFRNNASH